MLNNKILITIVTPFYNAKNLLKAHFDKIQSLIKHASVEIIYVDDGSCDYGFEFLKEKTKNLNNIQVIRLNKNNGPGVARNVGIKKANGNFILFLDVDDELFIKGFNKLIYHTKKNLNCDLFFFDYIKKNKDIQINLSKKKLNKDKLIKLFLRTDLDMCPNFYLYRKKFLLRKKIFFQKGFYEDILFVLKVFVFIKEKKHLDEKVYRKNVNKNSITNTFSDKHIKSFIQSSFSKNIFFYKNIFDKFKYIYVSDLQYGLRGDYLFAHKLLLNCKKPKTTVKIIDNSYKKIINENFYASTTYDKTVKKKLFIK